MNRFLPDYQSFNDDPYDLNLQLTKKKVPNMFKKKMVTNAEW